MWRSELNHEWFTNFRRWWTVRDISANSSVFSISRTMASTTSPGLSRLNKSSLHKQALSLLGHTHVTAQTLPYLRLMSPPQQPHATPHFLQINFMCIWISGLQKREDKLFFHILPHRVSLTSSISFFPQLENWTRVSSWNPNYTSGPLMPLRLFLHFGCKQKYNLVAYSVQSGISLGHLGTQGTIFLHRIRPFYYPSQNCQFMEILMIEHTMSQHQK